MRRIPVFATLIVLAAVAVMVSLGFWQLRRLHEKEALLAEYKHALQMRDIVDFESDLMVDGPGLYRRVALNCRKIAPDFPLAGHNAQGETGWAHQFGCMFPHRMKGNFEADVVIGWSASPALVEWSGGKVIGTLVPGKVTETAQGNIMRNRVIADPPLAGLQANAQPDPNDIPNNHLAYAVQWFLFAATALVIYFLALRKRK